MLGAAALAVTDEMNHAVRTTGLNWSQVTALVLLRGDSGLRVTALAKRIGVHQTAYTRMVDDLQDRDLVERRHTVGKWTHSHPHRGTPTGSRGRAGDRGHSLLRVIAALDCQRSGCYPAENARREGVVYRTRWVAGVGFAGQFIGLGQVPGDAGWYPVIASRIVSVLVSGVFVISTTEVRRLSAKPAATALAGGAVGTVAIILYPLATSQQMIAIAVVLAALYPAVPVVLALLVLGEHITRAQLLGLLCAAAAIASLSSA
ncbi:MarR family winged helix-turn-helix transcriptional regulator [Saccharopolyspora pogona]|uniref:MarR family winged helix-turn-helix transcriptional regulator n=1 Tax=Saccharopolyspora pogona TaxID=333966 RepID=UPI001CC26D4C|nr:MarR family transcriptional regulator [Saccharopolyspora pogona]